MLFRSATGYPLAFVAAKIALGYTLDQIGEMGTTSSAYVAPRNKLFTEIGPRMKERNGGYTRVLKLGYRQGDAADVVILELVDYKLDADKSEEKKPAKKAESKKPAAKAKDASSEAKPKKTTTKKASEKKEEAPAN